MDISGKTYNNKLVISKLSIISFSLSLFSYGLAIFAIVNLKSESPSALIQIAPLIIMLSMITGFVLSIIDLAKKDRKKILSIIALVLCSLYILILILAILIVVLTKLR